MTNEPKDRNPKGRFAKGTSGNPAGRPRGSRNKSSQLIEELLQEKAEQLTDKVLKMASGGNILALRLCFDRLLPPCKDRPIHLELPSVENTAQVASAMSKVLEAIGDGSITPSEGETMANILAVHTSVLTTGDLDRRVTQLEKTVSAKKKDTADQDTAQTLRQGQSIPEADHE